MKTPDKLNITILDDGTIKIDTDRISMPNHANADAFVKQIAQLAGGTTEKKHKHGRATHTHTTGEQEHQHG